MLKLFDERLFSRIKKHATIRINLKIVKINEKRRTNHLASNGQHVGWN